IQSLPVADRPVSRVQTAAEAIGTEVFAPGTHAAIEAAWRGSRARDAAGRERIAAQIDAGFAAMAGNVDAFLDHYYSLTAEYLRLVALGRGGLAGRGAARLEGRLDARLREALDAATHLAPVMASVERLAQDAAATGSEVDALVAARR